MTEDQRSKMNELGQYIDFKVKKIMGERRAVVFMVSPNDPSETIFYSSNCDRELASALLESAQDQIKKGNIN